MFDSSRGKNLRLEFLTAVGIKTLSSGMRRHTYWQIYADISEKVASSSFRVEQKVTWGKTGHDVRTEGTVTHMSFPTLLHITLIF
jgi:hypothetical protein